MREAIPGCGGRSTGEHIAIYLIKRAALLVVVLLLGATFVFSSFFLAGGDPVHTFVPKGASELSRDRIIDDLKLNEPVLVQYLNFMIRSFTGDFPTSMSYHPMADIGSFIFRALASTLELYLLVAIIGCLLGAFLEHLISRLRSPKSRTTGHALALVLFAAPIGGVSLLLLMLIARWAPSYPLMGGTLVPVLAGIIATTGGYILISRKEGGDHSPELKGLLRSITDRIRRLLLLPERRAALLALSAWIMVIVLVTEVAFSRNGLGTLLWDSMFSRDAPLAMSVSFLLIVSMAMIQFALSVTYALVIRRKTATPRIPENKSSELSMPPSEGHAPAAEAEVPESGQGFLHGLLLELTNSWRGRVALGVIAVMIVVGAAAPLFSTVKNPGSPQSLESVPWQLRWNPLPPSFDRSPYTGFIHPLGTDGIGHDIYSLMIYGLRPELAVAGAMIAIALAVGIANSILAFAFRGEPGFPPTFVRAFASALSWTLISIPLIAGLVIVSFFDFNSFWRITTVVLIVAWAWAPQALFILGRTRINAGEQEPLGLGDNLKRDWAGILHVGKLVFLLTYLSISAIAFMGLMDPQTIYWGGILGDGYQYGTFADGEWWIVVPPAVATLLLSAAVYVVLDALERSAKKLQV